MGAKCHLVKESSVPFHHSHHLYPFTMPNACFLNRFSFSSPRPCIISSSHWIPTRVPLCCTVAISQHAVPPLRILSRDGPRLWTTYAYHQNLSSSWKSLVQILSWCKSVKLIRTNRRITLLIKSALLLPLCRQLHNKHGLIQNSDSKSRFGYKFCNQIQLLLVATITNIQGP